MNYSGYQKYINGISYFNIIVLILLVGILIHLRTTENSNLPEFIFYILSILFTIPFLTKTILTSVIVFNNKVPLKRKITLVLFTTFLSMMYFTIVFSFFATLLKIKGNVLIDSISYSIASFTTLGSTYFNDYIKEKEEIASYISLFTSIESLLGVFIAVVLIGILLSSNSNYNSTIKVKEVIKEKTKQNQSHSFKIGIFIGIIIGGLCMALFLFFNAFLLKVLIL